MWVCPHCSAENKDGQALCAACGASRPLRRFGSAPSGGQSASAPPRVTAAGSMPPAAPAPAYQGPEPQDDAYEDEEEPRRQAGGSVFGKIVGGLLIALLPLLTGLLAWRQQEAISAALLPLYLTEKAPDWLRSVFYGLHAAAAILLAMLPGLWTLLLSRAPRRKDDE